MRKKVEWTNGWNKEKFYKQIEKKNGWSRCTESIYNNSCTYRCAYRNEKGKACAIGAFIPDSMYKKSFEGHDIRSLLKHNSLLLNHMPFKNITILHLIQSIHDGYNSGDFETHFKKEFEKKVLPWIK